MLYYAVSCTSTLQVHCTKVMKGAADKNKINSVCLFSNVSVVNTSLTYFELKLYITCFNIWNLRIIPKYYTCFLWFSLGREIISLNSTKKFSFVVETESSLRGSNASLHNIYKLVYWYLFIVQKHFICLSFKNKISSK